jgi:hypothetical protein
LANTGTEALLTDEQALAIYKLESRRYHSLKRCLYRDEDNCWLDLPDYETGEGIVTIEVGKSAEHMLLFVLDMYELRFKQAEREAKLRGLI